MRRVLLLSVFALLACSNSSSGEPANTNTDGGGVDSGKVDSGRPDVPDRVIYPEITCGPGPYVTYEMQTIGQTIGELSKEQPLLPIKVSMSACPEVKGLTDSEGYARLRLTVGQANSLRLDADGWLPTRWHELTPQSYMDAPTFTIMAKGSETELPGFAADKGVILVDVAGATAGTCFTSDGVTISVKDHPEAVITYHAGDKPFGPMSGATATSTSGLVSIAGIAPGTKVTILGTKTDCDVASWASPGTVLVEAGVVSRTQLMVRQAVPSCGPPPWVLLAGHVTTRQTDGMAGPPVEGVNVSFTPCPGVVAKTDATGLWQAWVGLNMPFGRQFEKDGYYLTLVSEQAWPQDYEKVDQAIRAVDTWKTLMPSIDTTHGYALVGISAPKTGDCTGADGITITVKDHPDAKVFYMNGEPPKAVTGTATTTRGLAYVSGLKPGDLLEGQITGSKTGCTYSTKGSLDTGKAKLVAGAVTNVTLYPTKTP